MLPPIHQGVGENEKKVRPINLLQTKKITKNA
jgi:hypothetical protein